MAEPGLAEDDYAAIETAVMETARGRWFLAEYARRNRNTDTVEVLSRLNELEGRLGQVKDQAAESQLRLSLNDMASAIARTKIEIAAIHAKGANGDPIDDASAELDAIVSSTERATGDILSAAETVQEIGFALREAGVDPSACDLLDAKAVDIYTACSFQDITGQRTHKVVQVLRYLEARIDSLLNAWGRVDMGEDVPTLKEVRSGDDALLNGPARPGHGLEQVDVDLFMLNNPSEDIEFIDAMEMDFVAQDTLEDVATEPQAPAVHDEPLPQAAVATAAAALAMPDEPVALPPSAEAPLSEDAVSAPLAPADVPGLPKISDIEKLSFAEKSALFS